MFKQTFAVAALALAVAAPAGAATPLPTALGGLMSFSRDAARVYVLRTGTAVVPVLGRFKFAQEVKFGSSPNQPFPPLPGLSGASFGPLAQTGIGTLQASVPFQSTSEILPVTGIKTTKISTGGGSGAGAGAASQLIGTFTSLPKIGAVVITSTAGSLVTLPKTGAAVLRSSLP